VKQNESSKFYFALVLLRSSSTSLLHGEIEEQPLSWGCPLELFHTLIHRIMNYESDSEFREWRGRFSPSSFEFLYLGRGRESAIRESSIWKGLLAIMAHRNRRFWITVWTVSNGPIQTGDSRYVNHRFFQESRFHWGCDSSKWNCDSPQRNRDSHPLPNKKFEKEAILNRPRQFTELWIGFTILQIAGWTSP